MSLVRWFIHSSFYPSSCGLNKWIDGGLVPYSLLMYIWYPDVDVMLAQQDTENEDGFVYNLYTGRDLFTNTNGIGMKKMARKIPKSVYPTGLYFQKPTLGE